MQKCYTAYLESPPLTVKVFFMTTKIPIIQLSTMCFQIWG